MRELYIQGKGKIDCETILSALLGLGADPEKIRERLEKLFSLPVGLKVEKPEKENMLLILPRNIAERSAGSRQKHILLTERKKTG